MKPLKDELIQSRLDEDELADFDKVKKLLDVKSNSVAIRQMIKDEMRKPEMNGSKVILTLIGITGTKTSSQLSILQNQFADIQSQLESIMYSVTKMVD